MKGTEEVRNELSGNCVSVKAPTMKRRALAEADIMIGSKLGVDIRIAAKRPNAISRAILVCPRAHPEMTMTRTKKPSARLENWKPAVIVKTANKTNEK